MTQTDLAIAILQKLNIVSEWQTPSSQQANTVKEAMGRTHQTLMADKVIRWDLDSIPDQATQPFIDICCNRLRNTYMVPLERHQAFQIDHDAGMVSLYRQNSIEFDGETVKAEYF